MPVTERKHLGGIFYTNGVERTGAQEQAIKNCPPDSVNVAYIVEKKRGWGHMTPGLLLKHTTTKNNHLYEMVTKFPFKAYLDIDKYASPDEAGIPYLNEVKTQLLEYFPRAEMAVSGSITEKKTSFHIVLPNYVIHDENERTQLAMIVKHLSTTFPDGGYDHKVYSKNRLMKCINQSKPDGRVQEVIENDDLTKHFITCFMPESSLHFEYLPDEVKELVMIKKSTTTFNLALLPELSLACPKNVNLNTISPEEVLRMLPNTDQCDFTYRHRVCRFCGTNGIQFELFLAWICSRHANMSAAGRADKQKKWMTHWGNLHKFPPMSIDGMKPVLKYFYPNIFRDVHFRRFADTFLLPADKIEKIETIIPSCFQRPEKCLVFNVGMGGGKTAQTISYLKAKHHTLGGVSMTGSAKKFLWIAPNKALSSNTLKRFEDEHISVSHYEKFTTADKRNGTMRDADNLIICLNSIHYLGDKTYDILVIDEIETLVDKFLGDFLEQGTLQLKKKVWETFVSLFRGARKIILLDAFITTKTINLLNGLGIDFRIFERINERQTRTIKYTESESGMILDIVEKLRDGLKVFIFYPYKHGSDRNIGMEALAKTIESRSGKCGVFYNADVADMTKKELKNVNEHWSTRDFVITNNIVTCGVNYENTDFDYTYLFIASHNTPRDIIQVSYRLRYLSTNIIKVCYLGKMTPQTTWLNDIDKMDDAVYGTLHRDILVEKKAPIRRCFQHFCVKAHYKQDTETFMVNNVVEKELRDDLDANHVGMRYADIKDCTQDDVDKIQERCIHQTATSMDKYRLNKFYFQRSFQEASPDNDIAEKLEDIWDGKYQFFFKRLGCVLSNSGNTFNMIAEHNNLPRLFPADIRKIKLTDDIKHSIFKEFSFKYITPMSATTTILKEIYNSYFSRAVVMTEVDDSKHAKYRMDGNIYDYYDFAKSAMILDKQTGLTYNERKSFDECDPIEC